MFLLGISGPEIMEDIRNFVQDAFTEFADLWYWAAILVGLMVLSIIVMFALIIGSYESRILKSINKINSYFLSKPFITEENLVEFNLKMKKVPKVLRNNWQIYMLNREDSPSTYINVNSCIDKPLRTSSIEKNIGNFTIFTVFLTFLSFIVGLQYAKKLAPTNFAEMVFYASLVPLAIVFLYTVFVLIFKAYKNDKYSLLYDVFPLYERNLTKAVSTLPAYVDYEILFTRQEIREGIPILQQYLEKRALIEQQELEKARANSMAVEEYDFAELGIDGSLVLERAMKECETFIRTRSRLQEECGQIEAEKENYKKNFELTTKDYQRKLQASRENLESLKSQQESSTNRIESNYIRKQQGDEIKKQQQLEKDNEEATVKFNEEQISLQQEIDKRKQEIEEKKAFVQQAMMLEFKHYANTLYKALTQKATEIGNQKLVALAQENADLKALLSDMQNVTFDTANPQEGLMQNEEVTTENLYDLTSSDEQQMQENRETSEAYSQEETAIAQAQQEKAMQEKQAQTEADLKAQQENSFVTEENINSANAENNVETANAVNTETDVSDTTANNGGDISTDDASAGIAENVEPIVEVNNASDGDDDTSPIAENANYNSFADASVNSVEETVQPVENVEDVASNNIYDAYTNNDVIGGVVADETSKANSQNELDEIQKQIEEENNKLLKQKQEFESELNDTISRMEAPIEQPVPEAVTVKEEPATQKAVVEEPIEEEDDDEELESNLKPPVPRRTSRRTTASRSSRTTKSAPKPRAVSRSRTSGTKKASSEIDALNAEMQKLIDSTKK